MARSTRLGPSRERSWPSRNGGCRGIGNGGADPRAGGGPIAQAPRRVLPNGSGELGPFFHIDGQEEHLQGVIVTDVCSVSKDIAPWQPLDPDTPMILVSACRHFVTTNPGADARLVECPLGARRPSRLLYRQRSGAGDEAPSSSQFEIILVIVATMTLWFRHSERVANALEFCEFVSAKSTEAVQFRNDESNTLCRQFFTVIVVEIRRNEGLQGLR